MSAGRQHIDPRVLKRIAELTDGDSWELADFLVEEFSVAEYGTAEDGRKTGLYAALDDAEDGLRQEYGIEAKANWLRDMRGTALAWPAATRTAPASFAVYRLIRGKDRETRMARYQKRNKGRPLTAQTIRRFRSDDNPKAPVPFDETAEKRITSTLRSLLLGGIITKRDDWWEAAAPESRTVVAAILRDLANKVQP